MNHTVTPAELTLTNGNFSVKIRPRPAEARNPIMCRSWDLGSPEVRFTAVPNPGADGVTLSPGFLGSRTVVFELQIIGDPEDVVGGHDAYWYAMMLTRMTHPNADPILQITRVDDATSGAPWTMQLRGNPYSLAYTSRAAAMLEMQLTFLCPSGFLESALRSYATRDVVNDDTATDWIFPAIFPKGFGLIGGISYPQLSLQIAGDAAISPIVYIHGPCTDPMIVSTIPGNPDYKEVFAFDGLTLQAGQTVGVDMGSGDIFQGNEGSDMILDDMSAYALVDWSVSSYWVWEPGPHTVVFLATGGSITVQYFERRFTI